MRELDQLQAFGIDPTMLEPAPAGPLRTTGYEARITSASPTRRTCSACGAPAVATRIVDLSDLGLRWQDSCRDCMVARIRLARP